MALGTSYYVDIDFYTDKVYSVVNEEMRRRIGLVTSLLKNTVLVNISIPVEKITTPSGRVVKKRSDPGEFPRTDTGKLIATMMSGVHEPVPGIQEGYVGSPLDYGLYLETGTRKMAKRPFLTQTLFEQLPVVQSILSSKI